MSLKEIIAVAHQTACEKGFWEETDRYLQAGDLLEPVFVSQKLALIHSEVSEALEALCSGTKEEFAEELADVIIRTADLAGALGITLESVVASKLEKNKLRPIKHGKRF